MTQPYWMTALIGKRDYDKHNKFGGTRIMLKNVRLNGNLLIRDHMWIKESKRMSNLPNDSLIYFRANFYHYININTLKCDKLKLGSIKHLTILDEFVHKKHRKNITQMYMKNNGPYIENNWLKKLLSNQIINNNIEIINKDK